jgi:hypothetical protein
VSFRSGSTEETVILKGMAWREGGPAVSRASGSQSGAITTTAAAQKGLAVQLNPFLVTAFLRRRIGGLGATGPSNAVAFLPVIDARLQPPRLLFGADLKPIFEGIIPESVRRGPRDRGVADAPGPGDMVAFLVKRP